jgi:hypothetical protein
MKKSAAADTTTSSTSGSSSSTASDGAEDKGGSVIPKQNCPHIFEAFDFCTASASLGTSFGSTCEVEKLVMVIRPCEAFNCK